MGYSLCGHRESDKTERLTLSLHFPCYILYMLYNVLYIMYMFYIMYMLIVSTYMCCVLSY